MSVVVGYAILPWEHPEDPGSDGSHKGVLARGMQEIKEAGFDGVEALAFSTLSDDYARRWMKFSEMAEAPRVNSDAELMSRLATLVRCARDTGLQITNIFCDGEYINPAVADAEYDQACVIAMVASMAGARHLLIAGGPRRSERLREGDVRALAARATEIGNAVAEYGIQLCFHPHIDTAVETAHEIEMFFNQADPEAVAFGLDTAHLTVGGADPVKMLRDNMDRVKYLHIKDVQMPENPGPEFEGPARFHAFRDLGEGQVNFREVGSVLREAGFDGPIIAELDRTPNPGESARIARRYFRDTMGI